MSRGILRGEINSHQVDDYRQGFSLYGEGRKAGHGFGTGVGHGHGLGFADGSGEGDGDDKEVTCLQEYFEGS